MYSSVCYNYSGLCCILDRELGFTVLHTHDINCQLCFMLAGYNCLMQCPGSKGSRRPPDSGMGLSYRQQCSDGLAALQRGSETAPALYVSVRQCSKAVYGAAKLFMVQQSCLWCNAALMLTLPASRPIHLDRCSPLNVCKTPNILWLHCHCDSMTTQNSA